jgi:hypothetical protein
LKAALAALRAIAFLCTAAHSLAAAIFLVLVYFCFNAPSTGNAIALAPAIAVPAESRSRAARRAWI